MGPVGGEAAVATAEERLELLAGASWRGSAARALPLEQADQALEHTPTPASAWAGRREICSDGLEAPAELAEPPLVLVALVPGGNPAGLALRAGGLPLTGLAAVGAAAGGATLL